MTDYDYKELREKATASTAIQSDIDNLGKWFMEHGTRYWNGEFYDADDGIRVFPVYKEVATDEFEITGYEIR